MADPEPPQPTPFPIRIVRDPPSNPDDDAPAGPQQPQGKRSDFFYGAWEKFLAIEPRRTKVINRPTKKVEEERKSVEKSAGDGLQFRENASTSWEQAAAECKAKVDAIVEECYRLNQKYRDKIFNLEAGPDCMSSLTGRFPKVVDRTDGPPWIKRVEDIFDDPQFFIDGATATDVHQGMSGDCWFLAALMAVSAKKELIEQLCVARNEKVGVYGFVFYRDGEWIYEVIDDKLFLRVGDDDDLTVVRDWDQAGKGGMSLKNDEDQLRKKLQRGGEALYFSHCKSNETWLPLIEKAYAKAHGDYFAIEGGFASEGIEDLTGGVGVVIGPEDIMDKERFWREELSQVNEKYLFGGGSKPLAAKGFVGGHAYAVLQAWEEGDLKLLKLRNPWGEVEWQGDWSDGSKLWTPEMMTKLGHTFGDDGIFWMSFKDFLEHFPSINRVRIFNKDWQVAQAWTHLNDVPWTADYHDTKFQFTLSSKTSVVIVLSQPDDRYYYGLRGRYLYSLHFRLYKGDGEDKYIVRSMHNSGNETIFTRSVSAEIADLEPGTYDVLIKVTAVRSNVSVTAEEAVLKYAKERKEKLLHVGRRFDYAHTKGNLKALEKSNKHQSKLEQRCVMKDTWRKNRGFNMKLKERDRRRMQRINDAMHEKRKEVWEKRKERARLRKQVEESQEDWATEDQADGAGEDNTTGSQDKSTPETEGSSTTALADTHDTPKANDTAEDDEGWEDEGDENADATKNETAEGGAKEQDAAEDDGEIGEEEEQEENETSGSRKPDNEQYESPIEDPEELDDNDFEWQSDIDDPPMSDDEEDAYGRLAATGSGNEIFAEDPWNAMCILGLRVYSLNADAKVTVVKDSMEEDLARQTSV